ncbi:flavodoxin [Candidatus Thorarchaeota archaeon]|nr:MAG: flavodoxin [Candidatus Thorarchaeota archaeon]
MKCLLVVHSYHHKNTEKIAKVFSTILDAQIVAPQEVDPSALQEYDLIGFGSGIYGAKHHRLILELVDCLPQVHDKKAFIFSTSAIISKSKVAKDHSLLREMLQSKGYTVLDEFACHGFNTNSFMKYLGGMNKGRPNSEDLDDARKFILTLKEQFV